MEEISRFQPAWTGRLWLEVFMPVSCAVNRYLSSLLRTVRAA